MNEEKLAEANRSCYDTYREKVIDKEFVLNITPKECGEIVFKDITQYNKEILIDKCCVLKINNIRILKKIECLQKEITPLIENCNEIVKANILSSLVLFTYSFFVKNENVPDFEFIKNIRLKDNVISNNSIKIFESNELESAQQNEKSEEEKVQKQKEARWLKTLYEYSYSYTDTLDLQIADFVKTGYLNDISVIEREIKSYSEKTKIEDNLTEYYSVWNIFHNSFNDYDTQEFIAKMYNATKNNISHITLYDLHAAIVLLRKLGSPDKADKLIDLAINQRLDYEFFNTEDLWPPVDVTDSNMKNKFSKAYQLRKPKITLEQAFKEIISMTNYREEDIETLLAEDCAEYYEVLKLKTSGDICLILERLKNPPTFGFWLDHKKIQEITKKVNYALKKIKDTSLLNKERVEGIMVRKNWTIK